jgi:hypothetical protein
MEDERVWQYFSYLLRIWPAHNAAGVVWRASLESPVTGERVGFASLAELYRFLDAGTIQGAERSHFPKASQADEPETAK